MIRSFGQVFGREPDVVASAPGRVNLLGEHTDYNDGYVMPMALRQRTTVSMARTGGRFVSLYSDEIGQTVEFALDRPPSELFARYVFGCLWEASAKDSLLGLQIHVQSTVPMGVGLSSSAALEVATLRALDDLLGTQTAPLMIAQMAQRAERTHAGVDCGIMDQVAASMGDEAHALFLDTRSLETQPVPLPPDASVLVLDCGVPRSLATTEFNRRRQECSEASAMLGLASLRDVEDVDTTTRLEYPWRKRARHVVSENARVLQALAVRTAADFGALMNASHASLRDDFEVSVPRLDELVALLQEHGDVYGARLTGAGFGGACVALCRTEALRDVSDDVLKAFAQIGGRGRELTRVALGDRHV